MQGLVFLIVIQVLLWHLSVLWLDKFRLLGLVGSPVIATALNQYLGFLVEGHIDPFVFIAVVVSLLWCAGIVAVLEIARRKFVQQFFRRMRQRKLLSTLVGLVALMWLAFPSAVATYERYQFNAETRSFMLGKAERIASKYLAEKIDLPVNYIVVADLDRSDQQYNVTFLYENEEFAVVQLARRPMKPLSIEVKEGVLSSNVPKMRD